MARIRTIKPEFFTSEDIVALSPFARLLYIALWCEADKMGRMVWKPKTFKMRYFPADAVQIDDLCAELTSAGLVVLYGDGYAYIPRFGNHQHINPRESASVLPEPDECSTKPRTSPRVNHASTTRQDAPVTHREEGKGREVNTETNVSGVSAGPDPGDPDPIFGDGLGFLVAKGVPERGARSFLGKMRKEVKDDLVVVELLVKAQQAEIVDPVSWLREAARRRMSAGRTAEGVAL